MITHRGPETVKRQVKVVVLGQGYVGLPVSVRCAEVGYKVVGLDVDQQKVDALNAGRSYVEDISDDRLQQVLRGGDFRASTDIGDAEGFDFAVISVPTPLRDSLPDLSFIEHAAQQLSPFVTRGSTVILESTTFPGTTEELLAPILESANSLVSGEDFFLGYSPERINPGDKFNDLVSTPKVVSGVNGASLSRIDKFFTSIVERTVPVSGTKEAELAKLIENTFRHVNIALVNELSVFGYQLGIDTRQAIEAAATKPFGFMKFTPGPGVGGHCLPIDPSYLSWAVRSRLGTTFRFVELANDINAHRPQYVVERAIAMLNRQRKPMYGSKVLVIGLAYKSGTSDIRESPALRIVELLRENGASVYCADPFVPSEQYPQSCQQLDISAGHLATLDLAIIVTHHEETDYRPLLNAKVPVLDTQDVLTADEVEQL